MSEEKKTSDSPGIHIPPPLLFAGGFVLGLMLEWLLPFRVLTAAPFKFTGSLLMVIAGLLASWAFWEIYRARTTIIPHRAARALVTTGPFRYTRNPLYLSLALLFTGAALWFDVIWALVVLVPVVLIVQRYVIYREESHLEAKFGAAYLEYKRKTRRWL